MRTAVIFLCAALVGMAGPSLASSCIIGTSFALRMTQLLEDGASLTPPSGTFSVALYGDGYHSATTFNPATGGTRSLTLQVQP